MAGGRKGRGKGHARGGGPPSDPGGGGGMKPPGGPPGKPPGGGGMNPPGGPPGKPPGGGPAQSVANAAGPSRPMHAAPRLTGRWWHAHPRHARRRRRHPRHAELRRSEARRPRRRSEACTSRTHANPPRSVTGRRCTRDPRAPPPRSGACEDSKLRTGEATSCGRTARRAAHHRVVAAHRERRRRRHAELRWSHPACTDRLRTASGEWLSLAVRTSASAQACGVCTARHERRAADVGTQYRKCPRRRHRVPRASPLHSPLARPNRKKTIRLLAWLERTARTRGTASSQRDGSHPAAAVAAAEGNPSAVRRAARPAAAAASCLPAGPARSDGPPDRQ